MVLTAGCAVQTEETSGGGEEIHMTEDGEYYTFQDVEGNSYDAPLLSDVPQCTYDFDHLKTDETTGYKSFEENDALWITNNINLNNLWLTNDISTNGVWLDTSVTGSITSQTLTVIVPASFAANVEQFNAMKADLNVIRLSGTRLNIQIAQ